MTVTIQSLPNELLLCIFGAFTPQPHDAGAFPMLESLSRNRSTLLNLSKTCRDFTWAANTLLYETIVIDNPSRLISLLCTVAQDSQAAPRVKNLACFFSASGAAADERIQRQRWDAAWAPGASLRIKSEDLTSDAVRVFQLARLFDVESDDPRQLVAQVDNAGERLLATLISLVPNLRSVVLHAPGNNAPVPFHIMSSIFESAMAGGKLSQPALQRLHAVRILSYEPEDARRYIERPPPSHACGGLLKAPNLAVFESREEFRATWAALPHGLKDVRLEGSRLEPDTLGIVCSNPNLERLTVQPRSIFSFKATRTEDDIFNAALTQRASTLKYLRLHTEGNDSFYPHFGPLQRLHCLSAFSRLEELDMELFALVGDPSNMAPETGMRLQDLLPPSLQILRLTECWRWDQELSERRLRRKKKILQLHTENLRKMLTSFARSCASGHMPALRKFTMIRAVGLDEWRRQQREPGQSAAKDFLEQSTLFAKAGVKMKEVKIKQLGLRW